MQNLNQLLNKFGVFTSPCYWCQTGLGAGKHTANKVAVNRSTIQRPLKDPQKSETKHQKSPKDPASERPNVQIWVAGSKIFPLLYPMFHLYIFTWSCFGKSWSYYSLQLYLLDAEDQRTGGGWWFCSIIGWYVFVVVISRYVIVTFYLLPSLPNISGSLFCADYKYNGYVLDEPSDDSSSW